MRQAGFTAKELFAMAILMDKQRMYGIPDEMSGNFNANLNDAMDALIEHNTADVDMDGRFALRPEYYDTVETYCNCKKCMTLNVRTEDLTTYNYIFWVKDNRYVMAEVLDDKYIFSAIDNATVKAFVVKLLCKADEAKDVSDAIIPQIDIKKARRACDRGEFAEMMRIIRKNGASPAVADVIAEGLQEKSYYFRLEYIEPDLKDSNRKALTYICSDGILLSLEETVANLRTCAAFIPISSEHMAKDAAALVENFIKQEGQ